MRAATAPPIGDIELTGPAIESVIAPARMSVENPAPRWRRRSEARYARARAVEPARTIVHVTAEYSPYARTGGLGEAVAGLAGAQARAGHAVLVIMPLFGVAKAAVSDLVPVGPAHEMEIGGRNVQLRYCRDGCARRDGPLVMFVDAPEFFDRPGLYGEAGADYPDNCLRFAVFSRAALQAARPIVRMPTIIHAHDWHSGLLPVYARTDPAMAAEFAATPVVFTVHNAGYQGRFPDCRRDELGVAPEVWSAGGVETYGQVTLLKGGLAYSDEVVTVSPSHAAELVAKPGGFGLEEDFRSLDTRLAGICNGIDVGVWNPATDPLITANYTPSDLTGKAACKVALQRRFGLPERGDVPLFAMSTRVVEQKGFDLVLRSARIRSIDAQFVFLGKGEPRYHAALSALADERPGHVAVEFNFTDTREHEIMAGADFLLMPSLYEPCGLTQMRAQRYGVPVVARSVGGLRDTVDDGLTGFLFDSYDEASLDAAIDRAVALCGEPEALARMRRRAMGREFGWERSAERYLGVYDSAARRSIATG